MKDTCRNDECSYLDGVITVDVNFFCFVFKLFKIIISLFLFLSLNAEKYNPAHLLYIHTQGHISLALDFKLYKRYKNKTESLPSHPQASQMKPLITNPFDSLQNICMCQQIQVLLKEAGIDFIIRKL